MHGEIRVPKSRAEENSARNRGSLSSKLPHSIVSGSREMQQIHGSPVIAEAEVELPSRCMVSPPSGRLEYKVFSTQHSARLLVTPPEDAHPPSPRSRENTGPVRIAFLGVSRFLQSTVDPRYQGTFLQKARRRRGQQPGILWAWQDSATTAQASEAKLRPVQG